MRTGGTIAAEALAVFAIAICVAFLANALSPRGLRLSRDYFPAAPARADGAESITAKAPPRTVVGAAKSGAIAERLAARGLAVATHEEVVRWFQDPLYAQGLIVFVDARSDAHYRAGHIPGAWPFDHYRAEQSLPLVLPACLPALRVVVYCSGGDCEDSEFAAVMLRDAGVPRENLLVYSGGIAEWQEKRMPVERGERGGAPSSP